MFAGLKIVKSFFAFGEGVAHAAREVEFNAGRMEMGVEEYQKLAQVAKNYGMTLENLQIANTLFVRALGNAGGVTGVLGGHSRHAAAAMKSLGLNAAQFKGQRLEQILPVISDAMMSIKDPMERVTAGLNLFGHRGRSIMPMMAQGGAELRRQFAAAVPVFEELTIKAADRATVAGNQLANTWNNLINNSFGRALLNAFTKVAHVLTNFVLLLKELSKNSMIGEGTLAALGIAAAAVAGMIIVAWWPILVPILAVVAAFAALALLIDDIMVFMAGGDSLIGRFFDDILGPGGAEQARETIKKIWDGFKEFVEDVKATAIPAFIKDFKAYLQEIKILIDYIQRGWAGLKSIADTVAGKTGLTDQNIAGVAGKVWNGVQGAADWVAGKTGLTDAAIFGAPSVPTPAVPFSAVPGDARGSGAMLSPNYNFTLVNPIDGPALADKLNRVAGEHHDRALRDANAAVGGAQ